MFWLAVFLFLLTLLLIALELFLPSAGVLTVGAIASAAACVVLFFQQDVAWGVASIVALLICGPGMLILMIKYWHRTPIGRMISPETPHFDRGEAIPDRKELASLKGRRGRTVTPLRPVGTGEFDGRRVECISEWGMIDKGAVIEVTSVESSQVKVRPVPQS